MIYIHVEICGFITPSLVASTCSELFWSHLTIFRYTFLLRITDEGSVTKQAYVQIVNRTIVAKTHRPKSVCNRSVTELFCSVFVLLGLCNVCCLSNKCVRYLLFSL